MKIKKTLFLFTFLCFQCFVYSYPRLTLQLAISNSNKILIIKKDSLNYKNFEEKKEIEKEKKNFKSKRRNYEKIGKWAGILGISSVFLHFLATIVVGNLFVWILSLAFFCSFLGLILGLISLKKVKKKLMPLLGVIIGGVGILILIFWIILILALLSFFNGLDLI